MNFEIAFAILMGFLGGFVFAVIVLITLFKKLMKISVMMGDKEND